jgi:hypothetical protein
MGTNYSFYGCYISKNDSAQFEVGFIQNRKPGPVVQSKILPCGVMHLKILKSMRNPALREAEVSGAAADQICF